MALREILAKFGFDVDDRKPKKADSSIEGIVARFQDFAGAVAGVAVISGLKNLVAGTVAAADELGDTADQLGVSAQALQQWRTAVDFAGGSADAIRPAIKALTKGAYDAAKGGGEAAAVFRELRIEVKDQQGNLRTTEDLFYRSAEALATVENSTERSALAQKLFGKGALDLLPLLKGGREGLEDYLGVLEDVGGAFEEDLLENADKADKSFKRFGLSTTVLKGKLVNAFLPALTRLVDGASKAVGFIAKVTKGTKFWQSALLVLGSTLASLALVKFGRDLLGIAKAGGKAMALVALALLIEDFLTLLDGGDSVIGRFTDALFGAGAGSNLAEEINAITAAMRKGDFKGAMGEAANALSELGGAIVEFFSGDSESMVAEFFSQIGGEIVRWLAEDLPQMIDANSGEIIDVLLSALSPKPIFDMISEWSAAGADLVAGLIAGITGAKPDLETAIIDLATGGLGTLKKKWQERSPSKAAEKSGYHFTQGAAIGVEKAIGQLHRASTAVATAALGGISAPARGSAPARAGVGGVVFQSHIQQTLVGNPAPETVAAASGRLRDDLDTSRRATLAALTQRVS